MRTQLNWSQYKLLISINDPDKREYYELESVNNAWTARETERQINSMLYERLLMSNDKESVLAVACEERIPAPPQEIKFKEEMAKGSTVGHLSDKDLKQLFVVIPNDNSISNRFDSILNLMTERKAETSRLTVLRDKLLPLLMNGQVEVA